MKETENKSWSRLGVFDTYELATNKKDDLIESLSEKFSSQDTPSEDSKFLVKIKRFGKGGEKYQVKYWSDELKSNKKKKGKKRVKSS